jgi:hypothetical protein
MGLHASLRDPNPSISEPSPSLDDDIHSSNKMSTSIGRFGSQFDFGHPSLVSPISQTPFPPSSPSSSSAQTVVVPGSSESNLDQGDIHSSTNQTPQSAGRFDTPLHFGSPLSPISPIPVFPYSETSSLSSPLHTIATPAAAVAPSSLPATHTPASAYLSVNVRRILGQVPFGVSLLRNDTIESLNTLTAKLLFARQRGRFSDYHLLWRITPDPTAPGMFKLDFAGQPMRGFRMKIHGNEHSSNKSCSYGCTKDGQYQFLTNTTYTLLTFICFIQADL